MKLFLIFYIVLSVSGFYAGVLFKGRNSRCLNRKFWILGIPRAKTLPLGQGRAGGRNTEINRLGHLLLPFVIEWWCLRCDRLAFQGMKKKLWCFQNGIFWFLTLVVHIMAAGGESDA